MSLAAPWPLKIILDNVVGTHKAPEWLRALRIIPLDGDKLELAAVALGIREYRQTFFEPYLVIYRVVVERVYVSSPSAYSVFCGKRSSG